MDLQLNDKLALVSGSTAGIGYAIATALAREGARVIVQRPHPGRRRWRRDGDPGRPPAARCWVSPATWPRPTRPKHWSARIPASRSW